MLGKIAVTFIAVAYMAVVFTAPSIPYDQSSTGAKVVRFQSNSSKPGTYSIIYELNNGMIHYETGTLSNDSFDQSQSIVEGTYWFVGPDNKSYEINYYTNQDGFYPLIGPGSGAPFKLLVSAVG